MKSRAHRYRYVRHVAMSCFPDGRASVAPPTLSYATPQSWTYGVAITPLSPTTSGATSFAVTTGALPTGVSLNTTTGEITGTPTAWSASGSFKVTATGAGGSTESSAVSWTMAFAAASVTGLVHWSDFGDAASLFQASNGTTAVASDADPIGYSTDKSGTGNHVIQSTAGFRPTYRTGILNSKSVARFDGVDDYLAKTGLSYAQPNHIFVVARVLAGQDGAIVDGAGNEMRLFRNGATNTMSIYAGAEIDVTSTPLNWHVYCCKFAGASSSLVIDGVDTTGSAGTATATAFYFGVQFAQSGFANIEIAEVLIYNAALSAGDRTAVSAYLNSKWAVY